MHFSNLVLQQAAGASFISCSGSLPPGVEPAWLVDVLHDLLGMGVSLILDTSGAALAASLALPLAVLKVNSQELGEALGISIRSPQDAYEVAARVITSGPQNCIVTLGSVGAVLASPHGGWYVRPPTVRAVSAVGSGDAVLAGVASALLRGQSIVSALNLGIACGTANTLTVGAGNVHLADVDALSRATVLERLA
jgi:fructose-1-phosphate kinase PfkB-like protein